MRFAVSGSFKLRRDQPRGRLGVVVVRLGAFSKDLEGGDHARPSCSYHEVYLSCTNLQVSIGRLLRQVSFLAGRYHTSLLKLPTSH